MSWMDRLKGRRGDDAEAGDMASQAEAAAVQPAAEGEAATLAAAAGRTHASRHQAAPAEALDDDVDLDSDVPSVNRRKTANKGVTYAGFAVIAIIGISLIWAANGPKGPKKKEKETQLTNAMPRLEMPKPPPPPAAVKPLAAAEPKPIEVKPAPAKTQQGKRPLEWYERKMGAPLLVGNQSGGSGNRQEPEAQRGPGQLNTVNVNGDDGFGAPKNDLAVKLEPTITKAVSASMLPNRNFLLTKGTSLDCALETAIDSTLPGMTTCRLTRDVYSDNGQVILLDRGTQLVGEYVSGLKNGQARLFVLWTRAKTPNGVVVSLNSPGADALGRAGHEGFVDNHWIERFGAAILMSVVKDTMAAIVANQSRASSSQTSATGTVIYSGGNSNPYANTMSGGEQIIARILDSTANIPPTLTKNQGDHIQVMVARDLDFADVYALKGTP